MYRFLAIGFLGAFLLISLFIATAHTEAATGPQILLTWRPQAYVPPEFRGRVLPTAGSKIYASVEVVDGGKLVNLSGQRIYWYVDDAFVESGANLQTINFYAPERTETNSDLRVELPDYKGGILKTVTIPIVSPRVVIETPFPGNVFSVAALDLRALPYFFNVSNLGALIFLWRVNGVDLAAKENPQELHADLTGQIQPGSRVDVKLSVINPRAKFSEGAGDGVSLLFNQ